jgi:hypothetical protein
MQRGRGVNRSDFAQTALYSSPGPGVYSVQARSHEQRTGGSREEVPTPCGGGNSGGVGAPVCGNYNFGVNLTNQSTYTPTATGATVTFGGDDGFIGPAQSLVNSYSSMVATSLGGGAYSLHNTNSPNVSLSTSGYDFVFQQVVPLPPAVWLFGSALGLIGVMRRTISS